MSYLKPKDLAQWLSKDYGGYFEIVEQYAEGGVTKNYVQRNQLNTITIKKGDQKLTYKVSDVYNGAYKLEDGGNLQKTAFYVPKRNVVKVQLRDGKDVKVANGYWIKKGAKPIHTSKYDDGGFMADVYANGGVIGKEMTFYRHGEEEKGIIGELNEDGSYNVSTKYSIILVEPQDVISIKDSTKKKGFFFEGGGKTTFKQKATAIAKNFEGKKVEPKYQKEYGKTYNKAEAKEVGNKIAGSQKAKYDSKMSGGGQIKVGDFLTLKRDVLIAYDHSEKSEKIHKGDKLEVVSISPNNPEFLRLKKENVSNNIGLRVSDFEKYELGGKTTSGGTTKRGGSMQLAKQIRKEGESWGSAIKRANEQIRNK